MKYSFMSFSCQSLIRTKLSMFKSFEKQIILMEYKRVFKITCFADEISPDLKEQAAVLKRNNVSYVEIRGVWDKNVLELTENEINTVRDSFSEIGVKVSCIGSPIGKVNIDEDFDMHLERFKKAVNAALAMDTKYIRIFSFYMDENQKDERESEVINRLKQMVRIAEDNGLILLHENEAGIYGQASSRCLRLLNMVDSSNFRAAFDPSNFVVAGEEVIKESYPRLQEYIEYVHVKDSVKGTGEIVVAGEGDGNMREVLGKLYLQKKHDMFLSLEPHLLEAKKYRGFSGPDLFEKDLCALRTILSELQIEYI